jgi:hypothetical protein
MMMPRLGRGELLLHQFPAIAVLHDLPIIHLVALTDRRARQVHGRVARMARAMMRGMAGCAAVMRRGCAMRGRCVMARALRTMVADVHPPVARARTRHRREWRRWRQWLGLGGRRRLGLCRDRLPGRRSGLIRNRLRSERRSARRKGDRCPKKPDTLHVTLPHSPLGLRQATGVRLDRTGRTRTGVAALLQPHRCTVCR